MNQIKRPLPFILASTNTGLMILNHLDEHKTPRGSYGVGYNFLQNACFDQEEIDNCVELLKLRRQYFGNGVMAIDCGANIGAHSIRWGIEMTYWGSVISFEAQERIYYALAGNIAINNCFNIKALNVAIGCPTAKNNTIDIPYVDYTTNSSFGSLELKKSDHNEFIGQNVDYKKNYKISLVSIDSLELNRLDFLKIDIEGMEYDAIRGGGKNHKQI